VITVLRPLSTSQLLDRTFHLYRNHFLTFVGITAIPQLFILALLLAGAVLRLGRQENTSFALTAAGYLLFYLAVFISQAPTIAAVSNLHMERPATLSSAFSSSRRALLRVIWIVFVMFVIMFTLVSLAALLFALLTGAASTFAGPAVGGTAGAAVLGIAAFLGLRWVLNWSLIIPVTVLEGGGFWRSAHRSKDLARGTRGRIFTVFALMTIFAFVVGLMIQFLLLLVVPFLRLRDAHAVEAAVQGMQAVGVFASTSLVGALATIALSLIYYDQRVRKEGYDLQLMMTVLEGRTSNAAAPAS